MGTTVRGTAYGAAAYRALAEVVKEYKRSDPLQPVTLIVPSERVGVVARRALAAGLPGEGPGVAALRVLTLRRFAEIASGQALARDGRRPLTGPVLIGALRAVLRAEPGLFAPVAAHIGTARALARAYRELRELPESVVDGIAGRGEVAAETVRVCRSLHRGVSATAFDEVDLLRAARAAVERAGNAGTVVAFLPQDLSEPEQALLAAIGSSGTLHVVVGMSGDGRADAGPVSTCHALGAEPPSAGAAPVADRVLHASDPDDEVRAVLREVLDALAEHPGYRISVLYGSADPYARLLHEHCARAGIEVFGRAAHSMAEGRFGRALLRLLALPEHDFRRDEVLAFVADAPVRHDGAPAPASVWERISRTAGVVRGDDWDRLRTFAQHRRTWLADHPDAEQWRVDAARRHVTRAEGLHDFVTTLRAHLAALAEANSWQQCADALLRLWSQTLRVAEPDVLPPEDRHAVQRIESILASLGKLDELAGAPDELLLRQLIELALDDELDRVGRIGQGVHIGPVSEAIGDDADFVFVLGAAEGLLPARIGDDPLLPDAVRAGTDGALPTQVQRVARQHRQVLAALAAAPEGGRLAAFSRGDLRSGGTRVPSRWLLPTLRALAGGGVTATRWHEVAGLEEVPSYAGALERAARPATEQEWRQRAAVDDRPLDDAILLRAREVRAARASERFTAFDGNLAGERLPDPTAGDVVSATSLESWVHCPHGYFLRHLLGVRPVEQPEQVVRISALDRGTVQHDILEALVVDAAEHGYLPGPGEPWQRRARDMLETAAAERFRRAEDEGVTGFALLWSQDREAIRADLRSWLDRDDARRRELGGLAPVTAEWEFNGAEFPLGDGRKLRLRGKIDRIDRAADGAIVVIDYKTGKADPYRALSGDNPCDRGQRLQLPVYAVAAQPVFGTGGNPARAEYWFTTSRAGFERIGYLVDESVLERARAALRTVADGITGGVFPARPKGNGNALYECPACDPDGLGEGLVAAAWQRKAEAPELAALRALLGEEEP